MLTLSEASELANISRSALLKAIRQGRLSATRDGVRGPFRVDSAELARVYPFDSARVRTTEKPVESSEVLAERVRALERLLETVEDERDNLRNRLERSEDERGTAHERLTALLTHQPETKSDGQEQAVSPWLWVLLAVVAIGVAVAKWMAGFE